MNFLRALGFGFAVACGGSAAGGSMMNGNGKDNGHDDNGNGNNGGMNGNGQRMPLCEQVMNGEGTMWRVYRGGETRIEEGWILEAVNADADEGWVTLRINDANTRASPNRGQGSNTTVPKGEGLFGGEEDNESLGVDLQSGFLRAAACAVEEERYDRIVADIALNRAVEGPEFCNPNNGRYLDLERGGMDPDNFTVDLGDGHILRVEFARATGMNTTNFAAVYRYAVIERESDKWVTEEQEISVPTRSSVIVTLTYAGRERQAKLANLDQSHRGITNTPRVEAAGHACEE